MLTYIVSLEIMASTFPIFATTDGEAAQRTAVALTQDYPEALVTTTPVEFRETSLTEPSFLLVPSPLRLEQADGLVEILASGGDDLAGAASYLDLQTWPEQIRFPPLSSANYSEQSARAVPLHA